MKKIISVFIGLLLFVAAIAFIIWGVNIIIDLI